jgi:cullin 1
MPPKKGKNSKTTVIPATNPTPAKEVSQPTITATNPELDKIVMGETEQEILAMSPAEREKKLKEWVTKFSHLATPESNQGGFDMVEFYGVNIIKNVLRAKTILVSPFGNTGYSSLYHIVHTLISSPPYSNENKCRLYNYFSNHVIRFLKEDILTYLETKHGYILLHEFSQVWDKHIILTKWFNMLFSQLDKYFSGMEHEKRSVISESLFQFYSTVYHTISSRVRDCILHFVACERSGEFIQRSQLKSCVQMIETMGIASVEKKIENMAKIQKLKVNLEIYTTTLEEPFLNTSAVFHASKREEWLANNDTFTYYENVEKAIHEEEMRVKEYLNPQTHIKILQTTLTELMLNPNKMVKDSFATILKSADSSIQLDSNTFPEIHCQHMKTLFFILTHIQALPIPENNDLMNCFIADFNKYLETWTRQIMEIRASFGNSVEVVDGKQKKANTLQGDVDYINNCLSFYRRIDNLATTCLQNNSDIRLKITQAVVSLMNACIDITNEKNPTTVAPEMLSYYLDKIMKKSDLTNSATNMEKLIEECVLLFKHIRDKDVFIENYRDLLGKRLLNNKSTSIEDEKSVIIKINYLQGSNFTAKVDSMIKDIYTTGEKNDAFNESSNNQYKDVFSTQILSSSWKLVKESAYMVIPEPMLTWQTLFSTWFFDKQTNTKLKWHYTVGECIVSGKFGGKTFEFVVLPIYAIVLCVFNSCKSSSQELSFDDIMERTRIDNTEVMKRILHSLTCPNPALKTQVLLKLPAGNTIQTTDKFRANPNFSNVKRRIVVPTPSLDVEETSKSAIDKNIEEGRDLVLQACIVRIMKARKTLGHGDLFAEVIRQVNTFAPNPKQVKKCIESLIEREYLQRDESNTNMYIYLA